MQDLPVQAEIKEVEVVTQQIIVNNMLQNMTEKAQSLCCSECGKELYTFAPGISYTEAYQQAVASRDNLQLKIQVCPGCGKRLRYDFDIIDGEIVNE